MVTDDGDADADSTDGPDLQRVLPDGPLPESTLDALHEHDRVQGITPMKMDRENDSLRIYDFTIAFESVAYALSYDDGWEIISEGDDEKTVGVALQEYHHEHGIV